MVGYFVWAPRLALGTVVAALVTGLWMPPALGTPDELHMPLGLLALVANLFFHSHFLSWLLQSGFDVGLAARGRPDGEACLAVGFALKRRVFPWVVAASLASVATGILGMGTRALVVAPWVHGTLGATTLVLSLVAAWVEAGVAVENQALLDRMGLAGLGEGPVPGHPHD